jgi:hypothetical protein
VAKSKNVASRAGERKKINGGVIDYDFLCGLNEARHGVWSAVARDRWLEDEWPSVAKRSFEG